MNDDKPIDYESEHNKAINKLVKLRQKYDELEEDRDYVKSLLDVEFEKRIKLQKENEQLKKENQEYKALLQDMGMLMSDDEVKDIRNKMADKFIKPLLKSNGFDVDVDCTDGFTIIPNNQDLKEWIDKQELEE